MSKLSSRTFSRSTSGLPSPCITEAYLTFLLLNRLYALSEEPASTDTFTDFFTADGVLIVRGTTATGAAEIVQLKQRLLPTAGNKHWNHLPNTTTVASETAEQKVYNVDGIIQSTYDGGNCSQA